MKCPKCQAENKTTIKEIVETYSVKGEDISIRAKVRFCDICGEDIWDEKLDSKNLLDAFSEYKRRHRLLQSQEIREIREKYQLSQVAFARVLGLGDKTVTRYENGSIADFAQNNLIWLAQYPSNFKKLLEMNKCKISEDDYNAACSALEGLTCRVAYSKENKYAFTDKTKLQIDLSENKYWGDSIYA